MRRRSPGILDYKGAMLIKALYEKASERGEWTPEIASAVGLSPSYFSTIVSGQRSVSVLNESHFQKIAEYLEAPLVQVYVLAEILDATSFFVAQDIENKLQLLYDTLKNDQEWAFAAPNERDWNTTPFAVKALVTLLYQKLVGAKITDAIKLGGKPTKKRTDA